jgi:PAS domain-containing protein
MIEFIQLIKGIRKMAVKSTALLAGAAVLAYALVSGTTAAPLLRSGALRMLSAVAPETACGLDTVLCLQRREDELREIGKNVADQGIALLFEKNKRSAELKSAELAVSDNARLLAAARDLYARCAMNGRMVEWNGALYTPAEFKDQLQLLWEEKAILEAARDRQRRFSERVEEGFKENGKLRARVRTELSLMPARIDAARRAALTADVDRIIGEIDQLVGSADRQIDEMNVKLRTTAELVRVEPAKVAGDESPKPRSPNPDFENFLWGGT